jgi:hypothetical protein
MAEKAKGKVTRKRRNMARGLRVAIPRRATTSPQSCSAPDDVVARHVSHRDTH